MESYTAIILLILIAMSILIECNTNTINNSSSSSSSSSSNSSNSSSNNDNSDVHRRLEIKIINGVKYLVKKMRRSRDSSSSSSSSGSSRISNSNTTSHNNDNITSSESTKKKRTVSYRFKNSRLGTTEYNKEAEVIALAKSDYERSKKQNRKGILCVTFVRASMQTAMTIYSNMIQVQGYCSWAIIFYDGSILDENEICKKVKNNSKNKIAACKRSAYALSEWGTKPDNKEVGLNETLPDQVPLNETEIIKLFQDEADNKEVIIEENDDENSLAIDDDDSNLKDLVLRKGRKSIPKSVLYSDLLPYLSKYKRIFLMDEDISLLGFDMKKTIAAWDCSFYPLPPPLVAQPLIAESKQFFNFVGAKSWSGKGVVASSSGLIEQQVPMFDAVFFEWFVKRCLYLTKQYAIDAGVDWGGDRTWCNAAKMYAHEVLQLPKEYVHCSLLIAATPVHHLNTKAIATKRTNRREFQRKGFQMVDKYVNLFPTWTIIDITRGPNPLDRYHGRKHAKSKNINATCVSERMFIF